ncbi:MAG TPA: hypothetical protein VFA55_01695 [Candidatus Kapabacteria bacterium]|nr:hypothetical protein [Candidatus Kapabacteria bacterium]
MKYRLIIGIALCSILAGCDLLQTRTPQPPSQQSSFTTPTSPDIVIQNFQDAIDNRDVVSYTRCFSDSSRSAYAFRFIAAADAQQYASTFLTWTIGDETAYFKNLETQTAAANTFDVFLDSLTTIASTADSTVYTAYYTLNAQHSDPTKPTQARGTMRLTVKADPVTQQWAITQWIDVSNGINPSWSVMKARFIQ